MATIGQHVFNVRNLIKQTTDDSKLTNRTIYQRLRENRNLIIKRENDKGRLYASSAVQSVYHFPLCNVDIADTCVLTLGYMVSKSTYKLPDPLDLSDGSRALHLYTIEFGKLIELKTIDALISERNRKYKHPDPSAFIQNNYLYVNKANIPGIKIMGIFADPASVQDLNTCITTECDEDTTCYLPMMDKELNIPGYLESTVENMVATEFLKLYMPIPKDTANNSKDDTSA